ncbi:hypothetical protein B0T19DRAFT_439836 [Cercophora scortea]|uniref:Uncharacterized protein n=1 Tax=Cercophora scortea TaxID=314031 RepID=A0AAE0MIL9_9PEZI|nr:hypothetical protein B0T19DRAFT_439836 [Cercophora scortea]
MADSTTPSSSKGAADIEVSNTASLRTAISDALRDISEHDDAPNSWPSTPPYSIMISSVESEDGCAHDSPQESASQSSQEPPNHSNALRAPSEHPSHSSSSDEDKTAVDDEEQQQQQSPATPTSHPLAISDDTYIATMTLQPQKLAVRGNKMRPFILTVDNVDIDKDHIASLTAMCPINQRLQISDFEVQGTVLYDAYLREQRSRAGNRKMHVLFTNVRVPNDGAWCFYIQVFQEGGHRRMAAVLTDEVRVLDVAEGLGPWGLMDPYDLLIAIQKFQQRQAEYFYHTDEELELSDQDEPLLTEELIEEAARRPIIIESRERPGVEDSEFDAEDEGSLVMGYRNDYSIGT